MDEFSPLSGVHRADAVVVGGGWTGLLTASFLSQRGLRVILLTENAPASGPAALGMTLHRPEVFGRIALHHGPDVLQAHLRRLRRISAALPGWLRPLAPFREAEFYTYARLPADVPLLEAQQALLQKLGLTADFAPDAGGCPFPVELSACAPGLLIEAAPLADSLCKVVRSGGGRIFGKSRVLNASAAQAFTADGRVDAPLVLLCTGKPLGLVSRRLQALLETRTVIHLPLKPPVPLHTVQRSAHAGGLTLLPLAGGAEALWDAGRTGTREELERTALLGRILRRRLPEWAAEEATFRPQVHSLDGLPIVGGLRAPRGQILFAAGAADFADALLAAQALARLALHAPREEDLLLRPDRRLPRPMLRQAVTRLRRHRAVNALRRSAPRCSHCACRLRFLPDARWWGCAGCGSIFAQLGQRLGGPALSDAQISSAQRPDW